MTESLIRLPALRAKLGLSRSTIYRLVAAGRFPAPIKLSPQTIAWKENEVEEWIDTQPRVKLLLTGDSDACREGSGP